MAQRAQLQLAAGGGEQDEDEEAARLHAGALQVAGEATPHGRLGVEQRLERAVGQRVAGNELHGR